MVLALLLPHVLSVTAFVTESYNPLNYTPLCWLTPTETRGGRIAQYLRYTFHVCILLASLTSMVLTQRVWHTYRTIVHKSQRHVFGSSRNCTGGSSLKAIGATVAATAAANSTTASTVEEGPSSQALQLNRGTSTTTTTNTDQKNRNDDHLRQATTQAVCYCLVYANQFVWLIAGLVKGQIFGGSSFAFTVVGYAISPLNGLFNAVIYMRPSYVRLRKEYPSWSSARALWITLLDPRNEPAAASVEL